jgi:hypothetical protein
MDFPGYVFLCGHENDRFKAHDTVRIVKLAPLGDHADLRGKGEREELNL